MQEIGQIQKGEIQQLRVLGRQDLIAIELKGKPYAPFFDSQGNIRRLIDPETQNSAASYDYSAFGEQTSPSSQSLFNPWQYSGKRFDSSLNLIDFGKRYYDAQLGRWLNLDPIGFVNSRNLYQYNFNSPFRYRDLDGAFAIAIPFVTVTLCEWAVTWITAEAVVGAITGAVLGVGVYQLASGLEETINESPQDRAEAKEERKARKRKQYIPDTYVNDKPLPHNGGVRIPDTDAPHTQLGTRGDGEDKYPQAREFDENGNPVKDIDFTDHGYPEKHPAPHQHPWVPNSTGGTPKRGNPEKVPGWPYPVT
jgi:RHS repeat-associated protein